MIQHRLVLHSGSAAPGDAHILHGPAICRFLENGNSVIGLPAPLRQPGPDGDPERNERNAAGRPARLRPGRAERADVGSMPLPAGRRCLVGENGSTAGAEADPRGAYHAPPTWRNSLSGTSGTRHIIPETRRDWICLSHSPATLPCLSPWRWNAWKISPASSTAYRFPLSPGKII